MDHPTTVFIADSAEEFCAGLTSALAHAGGFQVVGTAGDGDTALRRILEVTMCQQLSSKEGKHFELNFFQRK